MQKRSRSPLGGMLPLPTLGTASSCFVPLANESSPLPGGVSWPLTRFGAVEVQTLLTTVLHQSVPVLLTRFPSVDSNVLPVRFPLDAATKKTAKVVAVIASRRSRPSGRPRSLRGRIRSPPVRAAGSRPPPDAFGPWAADSQDGRSAISSTEANSRFFTYGKAPPCLERVGHL